MTEGAKWHWAEGMKYALEGMKSTFILNGAAAVSILTFIGNAKAKSFYLIISMVLFSFGAASGVLTMLFAYWAQLYYGNAEMEMQSTPTNGGFHAKMALKNHSFAYATIALGVLLFFVGIVVAAKGLAGEKFSSSSQPPAPPSYSVAITLNSTPSIAAPRSSALPGSSITIRLKDKSVATIVSGVTR